MERFLSEVNFTEWNLQQDKGRPFVEGVAHLSRQFPQYSELIRAYHENWIDSLGESISGTVHLLKRLKEAGYKLYGLSNWSAETFPRARERHDFFGLLDDMVISGEVGHAKPDPEIFQILLERIGKPAHACLFIDDAMPNIEQAQNLGFVTIHFQSPEQLEVELRKLNLL
jgi:2-haloacid dehalogenase